MGRFIVVRPRYVSISDRNFGMSFGFPRIAEIACRVEWSMCALILPLFTLFRNL